MLTRYKIKHAEGSLEEYNSNIGMRLALQQQEMEHKREENLMSLKRCFNKIFST